MSAMASQITGQSIVCATVCAGPDKTKHQSSTSRNPPVSYMNVTRIYSSMYGWSEICQNLNSARNIYSGWRHDIEKYYMYLSLALCDGNQLGTGGFPDKNIRKLLARYWNSFISSYWIYHCVCHSLKLTHAWVIKSYNLCGHNQFSVTWTQSWWS